MKRRNLVLVTLTAVAVFAALMAAALPLLVSPEAVRDKIHQQARLITGRELSFQDVPRISWFPFLGVEISNVVLDDPYGSPDEPPLLQVERLRAKLSPLAALTGRVVVEQFEFVRPKFNLTVHHDGQASWAFPRGNVSHLLGKARRLRADTPAAGKPDYSKIDRARLGRLQIVDGTVHYANETSGSSETLTNLNAVFDWVDTASVASFSGGVIWREESVNFRVNCPQLLALLAGGSSQLVSEISSAAFNLSFRGNANTLADLQLTGAVRLTSPSLRRIASFLGHGTVAGATLADFSLSAEMDATRSQIKLADAEVKLDGNSGSGALQITQIDKARPLISGTLAYGTLNAAPYWEAVQQEAALGNGNVSVLKLIDTVELDLRVSANTATFSSLTFSALAASISARNGEGLIDIGNAGLFGGVLVGKTAIARKNGRAEAMIKARLSGFDLASLPWPADDGIAMTGKGDLDVEISATGKSAAELAANRSGSIDLKGQNGALRGVNLAALRDATGEGAENTEIELSGQTPFSTMEAAFSLYKETAWLRRMQLTSPGISAISRGRIDLGNGGMVLRLRLGPGGEAQGQQAPSGAETADYVIGGSVAAPIASQDVQTNR